MTENEHVRIERSFDAPIDMIWSMWTEGQHFTEWYGPMGATIPRVVGDVVERVHRVPRVPRRAPQDRLHDQRHRVAQRPLPPSRQASRTLRERATRVESALPRRQPKPTQPRMRNQASPTQRGRAGRGEGVSHRSTSVAPVRLWVVSTTRTPAPSVSLGRLEVFGEHLVGHFAADGDPGVHR
jgi:hypothetical protein